MVRRLRSPGQPLGSGGGTANLLAEAWRATAPGEPFDGWLRQSRKLILHAGGLSRRLPAYAPTGKLLMPIPVFRWSRGQRLDQSLLDLQLPDYQRVLAHAGPGTAALVTSGDVLLRFARELPPFPEVDVLGLGMWVAPEKAKHFGVFFSPRAHPTELAFFLQKPAASKIRELAEDYLCLVDTGMWLLSERAVRVLMERCGWETTRFGGGTARRYELYAEFGLALGKSPTVRDAGSQCADLRGRAAAGGGVLSLRHQCADDRVGRRLAEPRAGRSQDWPHRRAPAAGPGDAELALRCHPAPGGQPHALGREQRRAVRLAARLPARPHRRAGERLDAFACSPGVCLDFVPIGDRPVLRAGLRLR